MKRTHLTLAAMLIAGICFPSLSQPSGITKADSLIIAKFQFRQMTSSNATLPYRLFVPDNYDNTKKYPLVLTLHGAGELGRDDSIHVLSHANAAVWARDSNQVKHPCFVVAPQCPLGKMWVGVSWTVGTYSTERIAETNQLKCVLAILDSLEKEFSIDADRMYINGISIGGYGVWDMITRHPAIFACAVPMCGGADTTKAPELANIPIWTFHCRDDFIVPITGTRKMMNAIKNTGRTISWTCCIELASPCNDLTSSQMDLLMQSDPKTLYSEYPDGQHVLAWRENGRGYDNPWMVEWVFQQSKAGTDIEPYSRVRPVNGIAVKGTTLFMNLESSLPSHVNASQVNIYTLQGRFLAALPIGKTGLNVNKLLIQKISRSKTVVLEYK